MPALLHHKLETALLGWIEANKGSELDGLNLCAAHDEIQPDSPFLVVACMAARMHPDFEGCGRRYPQSVNAVLQIRQNSNDGDHGQVAEWIEALDALITQAAEEGGPEYSKLIADLNPPSEGEDEREVTGLYLYAVHPGEDAGDFDGAVWDEMLPLEIVAQNGDPDPS